MLTRSEEREISTDEYTSTAIVHKCPSSLSCPCDSPAVHTTQINASVSSHHTAPARSGQKGGFECFLGRKGSAKKLLKGLWEGIRTTHKLSGTFQRRAASSGGARRRGCSRPPRGALRKMTVWKAYRDVWVKIALLNKLS